MAGHRFWSPLVAGLAPYTPGEQPRLDNLVKLNTNENPYPPSPRVLEALTDAADDTLRLYPSPGSDALRETIAEYHGIPVDEVFVGNGSDEVLAFVFPALLSHGKPVLFPDITYSFYPVYAQFYNIPFTPIPLDEEFCIRPEDYQRDVGGIIFPNPNAPTGINLPLAKVRQILEEHPDQVVVVDEAYVDFGGDTAIPLVGKYPNLLVVQTLSKSRSLAGLRVGFAIGQPHLIEALERVKNSFNSYPLDRLAQAGAIAAFTDDAYFQETRHAVMSNRDEMVEELEAMGFSVLPSAANFVFVRHPDHDAEELVVGLRRHSIIVRHFRAPRISQYMRITVGTKEQCRALIDIMRQLIA